MILEWLYSNLQRNFRNIYIENFRLFNSETAGKYSEGMIKLSSRWQEIEEEEVQTPKYGSSDKEEGKSIEDDPFFQIEESNHSKKVAKNPLNQESLTNKLEFNRFDKIISHDSLSKSESTPGFGRCKRKSFNLKVESTAKVPFLRPPLSPWIEELSSKNSPNHHFKSSKKGWKKKVNKAKRKKRFFFNKDLVND